MSEQRSCESIINLTNFLAGLVYHLLSKADLVVLNSLTFCLFGKLLISPLNVNESIAGNFYNMGQETITQFQEIQRVPGRINLC